MLNAKQSIIIRLLLSEDKENECWIAECLDYDIVAQADGIEEVQEEFIRMFTSKIIIDLTNGVKPLSQVKQAPSELQAMFNTSVQLPPEPIPFPRSSNYDYPADIPPYQIMDRRVHF